MPVDVSIAVINWNTEELLAECLDSIVNNPPLASYELRVVDNHSTDGSVAMVKKRFPSVVLTENPGNFGYSAAANQAMRQAQGKYLFILNTDTVVLGDAVDVLYDFCEERQRVGAAGPLILNTDGTIQESGRRFPSLIDASVHAFLGGIWPGNRFTRRYKMTDWDRKSERRIDWVSGAALWLRTEAVDGIGGFDDGYHMYVEDMDLCFRLWRAGWEVRFCPEAKITHHIGASSSQAVASMTVEFQKSIYRFYLKRYRGTWKYVLSPLVAVGLALRAATVLGVGFGRRLWLKLGNQPKE